MDKNHFPASWVYGAVTGRHFAMTNGELEAPTVAYGQVFEALTGKQYYTHMLADIVEEQRLLKKQLLSNGHENLINFKVETKNWKEEIGILELKYPLGIKITQNGK